MSAETQVPAPPSSGPRGLLRRVGWGVADQAVSSLSNFALSVFLAHALGARGFGAFTLVYVSYSFIVSACRGLGTDPLLVRAASYAPAARARAESAATATALGIGVLAGAVCVAVGLLLPSGIGAGFIALGVGLPGLMLQDSWRFVFFSRGRGDQALVNDSVWGVLQLAVLATLFSAGTLSATNAVLAFGLTATVAAGFGVLQARRAPALRLVRSWISDNHALGGPFLLENMALGGSRQLRVFAVGAIAGLVDIGWIRGAEVLMGPFLVVLMGVAQVAVPEVATILRRTPERMPRFCLGLGAVQAVAAGAWGVMIWLLLPVGIAGTTVGHAMLGDIWKPASTLLIPIALQLAIACFCTGAGAGLRAMGAAKRSLAAQVATSVLYLTGGVVGALLPGVPQALGSSWGLAVAQLLASGVWWAVLLRTHRDHLAGQRFTSTDPEPSEVPA